MSKTPAALARRLMSGDRWAALTGARLVEVREGYARTTLRLADRHLNGVDVVQGGAVFTLADFAFAAACNSTGRVAVAVDVSISYVKGVARGALVAEAREEAVTNRLSTCLVRVTDEAGDLVALFKGTAYRKAEAASAPR